MSGVEKDPDALRAAMLRVVDRRIVARGELVLPCVRALLEVYVDKLAQLFRLLGRDSTQEELAEGRRILQKALDQGSRGSQRHVVVVQYEAHAASPLPQLKYVVALQERSLEGHYTEVFARERGELFGAGPDAKVMQIASELGAPATAPVLDAGAGTGRNALALARRGHPVTAIEPVGVLGDELRRRAEAEQLTVHVIRSDLLSPELGLGPAPYLLVVLSEVASELASAADLRRVLERCCAAVAPGGCLLFNAFLPRGGYTPDPMARQLATAARSSIFTRDELAFLTDELAYQLVSDEPVYAFERAHQPPEAWPPTAWFESWSRGRNVFDLEPEAAPIELRWLLYRRRADR